MQVRAKRFPEGKPSQGSARAARGSTGPGGRRCRRRERSRREDSEPAAPGAQLHPSWPEPRGGGTSRQDPNPAEGEHPSNRDASAEGLRDPQRPPATDTQRGLPHRSPKAFLSPLCSLCHVTSEESRSCMHGNSGIRKENALPSNSSVS